MKNWKRNITLLLFALTSFGAKAEACDQFQAVSRDELSKTQRLGNAFAYSNNVIVVNDHTLVADAKSVELRQGSKSWTAQVIRRDFHTDLAIVTVPGAQFSACSLAQNSSENLTVIGYDKKDASVSKVPATLKTNESTKLMVPGIRKSLELVAAGQSELQSSQSGSLVMASDKVVGLVTQKTSEGTALAIPSRELDQVVRQMVQNHLPARNYEVDRKTGTIRFKGLKIEKLGVGGVDPHGSRVDPHGTRVDPHGTSVENPLSQDPRAPKPIALEDYDLGAVLVSVEDFNLLAKTQPQLAQALREAQVTRVFVSSVDGIQVRNTLELLRALGECSTCLIDSFWIEVKNPENVQDSTLRLMGWLSRLVVELEKDNKPEKVAKIVQQIHKLNPILSQVLNGAQGGRVDPRLRIQVREQWEKIEQSLDQFWHSEATLDILTHIREQM